MKTKLTFEGTPEEIQEIVSLYVDTRRVKKEDYGGLVGARLVQDMPKWYVSPEKQLERVRELNTQHKWGLNTDIDLPDTTNLTLGATEVVLPSVNLSTVKNTFDEHVKVIKEQTEASGDTFWRWGELKSDAKHLRQVSWKKHTPGLKWVVFDYIGVKESDKNVQKLWEEKADNLASSEVLSAAMLFPEWTKIFDKYPNMAGYQFNEGGAWSSVPCLDRWDDDRQLELDAYWADGAVSNWSSPASREIL